MHLAIVTHTVDRGDGQGRVNYEIATAAVSRGDRVTLVATNVAEEMECHPCVDWIRIPVGAWPTTLLRNQIFAWRSARWLRHHAHEIDVTLVNGFITWFPADINAAHFVHTAWLKSDVHTSRLRSGPFAWYQWLYTRLNSRWEQRAFRQASRIVAVSDRVAAELRTAGVPDDTIDVIANGVDLDEFRPAPVSRVALGLPEDVPLAFFVGDLQTPRKNLDTVLRALTEVPELHLAVAGDIKGSPYPTLAEQLNVSERVFFLGFRQDIPSLMRAADVCACPSRYEPFSLVLLEALASGCPVVTTRAVGAAPIVTPDCGAVIDDPDDATALAQALRQFGVSNSDQAKEARRIAARRAAVAYSWERTAETYLEIADEVAVPQHLTPTPSHLQTVS